MAISLIGTASAEATTLTMPTHAAGDILCMFAFRDGSTTLPTVPAGWSIINGSSAAGTTCCGLWAFKTAASSSETSGTWTSTTALICHSYRGAALPDGALANAWSVAVSATITWPALTLQGAGSSWVVAGGGHRSIDGSVGSVPTGMTARQNRNGATADAGSFDTNGPVSSWAGTTTAYGGTSSGMAIGVFELKDAAATNKFFHVMQP